MGSSLYKPYGSSSAWQEFLLYILLVSLLTEEVLRPISAYFINKRTNPQNYPDYEVLEITQVDEALYENALGCCSPDCPREQCKKDASLVGLNAGKVMFPLCQFRDEDGSVDRLKFWESDDDGHEEGDESSGSENLLGVSAPPMPTILESEEEHLQDISARINALRLSSKNHGEDLGTHEEGKSPTKDFSDDCQKRADTNAVGS